ncbi:Stp1/IreP family PP2C-type Ser/Thr phosphatase [Metasolibacillus meyeri]|uniref:Stp1/IreP family PP2C-type Ser/Thr phosphatase n=1 Tax=Metasolibacillus meyeri TaxID=1071052 RepID=A0AAW9NVY2_9BACL|nr:Stp1/IreP family PP2C-type Ser/Thr phosphatase [Metasolibacillus meyeri]MEC1179401.1 Stp1/IreP family PP2C-type Ser/Thr phosphatase [Metasolibacillus meyeri]
MNFTVESDVGLKRSENEDRVAFCERPDKYKLAVLADGMGGHNAGDVASEMAITALQRAFLQAEAAILSTEDGRQQWLKGIISQINEDIYHYSLSHEGCKGMGTTLIAVMIDGANCTIAHIGDSRVYHFTTEDGELITRDHSYVNVLVDNGEISEEEAQHHPQKNFILRALGTELTIQADFYSLEMQEDSYLLICSDGLSDKLSLYEMAAIITLPLALQEKGQKLVQLANELGGDDNISLILLTLKGKEV